MAKPDVNYSSLTNEGNPFVVSNIPDESDTENEETPQSSGVMIHVVPDTSKTRWNHIQDLDSFFIRMYTYHQNHGFTVMMLREILELIQFAFVVFVICYIGNCINFDILFNGNFNKNETMSHKITIPDAMIPLSECAADISLFYLILLFLAGIFVTFRTWKVANHAVQYYDMKKFFNSALKIPDHELDNYAWHEIQQKTREVQSEQQMCIHKEHLTELDIYHRILRFTNYMVAMVNKNLLPTKIYISLFGECVVLSKSLRYNIEWILFRGPWSPFDSNWHLREEYKKQSKRLELAQKLSRQIAWIALANVLLCPVVFLFQLMFFFFSHAESIKREPGLLSIRCWSRYAQLHFRHFNELDHELAARLNRAYRPGVRYMNSFSSPILTVIAKCVSFIAGGLATILVLFTIYDEDVLQVQHVIMLISILSCIAFVSRNFIPEDNLIWCPEQLMTNILAQVHYLPPTWRGIAHTSRVRDLFGQFLQFKAIFMLNEILSPVVCPFVLFFSLRPRSLELIDFFRNFTVSVVGVGDVCSFAQMDVRKHGNPDWHPGAGPGDGTVPSSNTTGPPQTGRDRTDMTGTIPETNQYTQGENGKTELSLVHFTLTNPEWKMPSDAKHFVQGLRRHAINELELARLGTTTAMGQSLGSVGSISDEYSSIVQSIIQPRLAFGSHLGLSSFQPTSSYRNPFSPTHQFTTSSNYEPQQRHPTDDTAVIGSSYAAPYRSLLQNIQETDDDGNDEPLSYNLTRRINQSSESDSFPMSTRRRSRMRCVEGPASGSTEGLIQSMYDGAMGNTVSGSSSSIIQGALPTDVTIADMSLSTLYLHELHHQHIRRRGRRSLQREGLWQRPSRTLQSLSEQNLDDILPPLHQPVGLDSVAGSSTGDPAAERTPLLKNTKKS